MVLIDMVAALLSMYIDIDVLCPLECSTIITWSPGVRPHSANYRDKFGGLLKDILDCTVAAIDIVAAAMYDPVF